VIELLLLFFLAGEQQTVYNFDIYSGEKVEASPLIQKILEGRKKSTTDYNFKPRPNFYQVAELPIFDKDFKITYWKYELVQTSDMVKDYKWKAYESYPFRNIYIANYLEYN